MSKINFEKAEKIIANQFSRYGFSKINFIQNLALKVILRDHHCLIVAPTGSGKTEAAILPVIKLISLLKKNQGIKAIYVTPLRALNNDVLRRISHYAMTENLTVEIRHGDTPLKIKKKIIKNPPDILITTPESIPILLTIENLLKSFKYLKYIIIDEVHELVSNERGSHLTVSIERLQVHSKNKLTRIGLSATLGNVKDTGKFLVGSNGKCAILQDKSIRKYDLKVNFVKGSINNVVKFILEYIKNNDISGSVLLFTNTRDEAEYFGTILHNQKDINIDIHHGSLSKEIREDTEYKLRSGNAGIVVCTSSLELGLDIGSIDLVVHYGSPRQVSKLMQRIGRSRHQRSLSAKGLIVTNIPDDEIECIALIRRMQYGYVEQQSIHTKSLDVLSHHLVGLSLETKDEISINSAFSIISKAFPFQNISLFTIESCLEILDRTGIIRYNRESKTFRRKIKSYKYYFENISTIPHILKFQVLDIVSKKKIGTLDQKFVGDYCEKGNIFVLKGSQWRVISIDELKFQVNVESLYGNKINVPYWVGELIPVDYYTCVEVGKIRNMVVNNKITVENSILRDFFSSFNIVPDSNNIVVETSNTQNYIIIHATFGTKINNTLSSLFSTLISSKLGYIVETRSDPYRILLTSSAKITKFHIESVLLGNYDIESILIASLNNTYQLNWKVWMVAKKFGLINKEALYDKKIARYIYDKYSKTPVSEESIRELIHEKYEVCLTRNILDNFNKQNIRLHWLQISNFSSLAKPILDHSSKFSATPKSIEAGVIDLVKERIEKTKQKFICIRCGNWERVHTVRDTPLNIVCPYCKSRLITVTYWYDNELKQIIKKKLERKILSKDENHKFERAWKISSLINNFGKKAVSVIAGHGIGADTAARILRDYIDEDELYRQLYKAERQYVITRGFWDS